MQIAIASVKEIGDSQIVFRADAIDFGEGFR
jgi:hypothetical protein